MMNRLLALLAGLLLLPAAFAADDELLPPDEAFRISARAAGADHALLQWAIADGYYLYKNKFRFSTSDSGVALGTPEMPPGLVQDDEFFGKVDTYRGQVQIRIPVKRGPGAPTTVSIQARSQGCADIGVCYPPHTQSAAIVLAAATPAAPPVEKEAAGPFGALESIARLGDQLGITDTQDEFLPPDEAFRFTAEVVDARTVKAIWQIADDYYLYRDKFKLTTGSGDAVKLGPPQFPAGKVKNDEFFGRMEVYYHQVELPVTITQRPAQETPLTLKARYQGCADSGLCYPPIDKSIDLVLPGISAAIAATTPAATPHAATPLVLPDQPLSEQDRVTSLLMGDSIFWIVVSMFGAGLLLSFTACVYPMIPILSSIIVGQGKDITTRRAFSLSLVFVEAVAITYAAIGMLSGKLGAGVQAWFQHPVVLISFAAVFVALSLSMFGFFNLQLPASLQAKLTEFSNRQRGGTLVGVFVMGVLSALIIGPCAGPVLIGALAYISQTGDYMLGGISLFALGNGLGAPLLLIGASGGKLLPKAGGWMNTVKAVFGVILLAVAIMLVERILPGPVSLLLWALLFIIPAIYLGALEPVPPDAGGWAKFWKGSGIAMLVYGVILVLGATTGGDQLLRPLHHVGLGTGGAPDTEVRAQHSLPFQRIKSVADLERALEKARAEGRYAMLDFYADWCVYCVQMEKLTFPEPEVQRKLKNVLLLQADVTANDREDLALLNHLGLYAPPAILFFKPDGTELRNFRLVGFANADKFVAHIDKVLQAP